jgi:hypothetical protein
MPRLEIGEYLAIIQDATGGELGRMMIVPRKRFPMIGECLPIAGKRYRVRDIEHPPDESDEFERFIYTGLTAYLVEEGEWKATPTDDGPKDTGVPGSSNSPHLAAVVLPFRGSRIEASSPLLGFKKLIALAVAKGYEEQAYRLERLKFVSWSLEWSGEGWVAAEIADGRTAEELRELSRAAKRAAAEAEAFCREVLPLVPADSEQPDADVIELAAFRRG